MAATDSKKERDLNKQLALVISCETTVKAMILLSDNATSPKAVGERLGISTTKASHHIKKLVEMGLAELIDEQEVGGAGPTPRNRSALFESPSRPRQWAKEDRSR